MTTDKLAIEKILASAGIEFKPKRFKHDSGDYLLLEEIEADDLELLFKFDVNTGKLKNIEGKCRVCNNDWYFGEENES